MKREDDDESRLTDDPGRWLTTGDMARLSGTTLRTVRFYEEEGLICSRAREDGSHRRFPQLELKKLQIITDLREAGLSLSEIKALVALKGACKSPGEAACRMTDELTAQLAEVDRRIETLKRVRSELLQMSGTLEVCRDCTAPDFPQRCRDCTVVGDRGASRTAHLLWKN